MYDTSMDIGVDLKKKSQVAKTGIVKHLTSPVILSYQWDSVESDTESLAQEKAYQQRLQKSINHPTLNLLGKDNNEGSRCGNAETEPGSENEFEDLQIYDSLELVERPDGLKTPPLLLTDVEKLDGKGAAACNSLSGDKAFSYLSNATKEDCGQGRTGVKKGGYSHVADMTVPAVVADSEQPFHLHLQNGHRSSVASTHSQLQAHVPDLSGPSSVIDENQSRKTTKSDGCEQQRTAAVTSRKLQQVRNDIVTSNKITLGRSTKKHGSYLKMHALKQDVLLKINREEKEQQGMSSSLSPLTEQARDPEVREELGGNRSSLCMTSSQPTHNCSISLHTPPLLFPVPQKHGFSPQQENSQLQQCSLQDLQNSPKLRLTPIPGAYKVLPPIEKPPSREDLEQSPEQSPEQSTSTDSYLVQMEKKQQPKPRVSYKAYTLKDYKQLKSDIVLSGLGPDYRSIEKTAEKMRWQKQYANAIREQNKNINRIPFIPAKEPKDNDQRVPRMKALEYARTIAKPPVLQPPKKNQTQRSRGVIEGLNMSELSRLEILKRRHEEEKRAFALLRK